MALFLFDRNTSPVRMSAENVEGRVNFRLSELDRQTGARLTFSGVEFTYVDSVGYLKLMNVQVGSTKLENYSDLANLVSFKDNADAEEFTTYNYYVYDAKGRYVDQWLGSKDDQSDYEDLTISNGYTVEIELVVDKYTAGELTNYGKGDGNDDRYQAVITVEKQHAVDSSLYDRPTASEYYVVNKGDNVAKMIKDGDYVNFPGWDDYTYDSDTDKEYVRVYNNALTKVTEDVTVKADWAEDKAGLDRFGAATPEKPENTLDKDGDGIVTCDEYYGVTGLKWDDKKNACVTTSGNAVVTVPDTSAR